MKINQKLWEEDRHQIENELCENCAGVHFNYPPEMDYDNYAPFLCTLCKKQTWVHKKDVEPDMNIFETIYTTYPNLTFIAFILFVFLGTYYTLF